MPHLHGLKEYLVQHWALSGNFLELFWLEGRRVNISQYKASLGWQAHAALDFQGEHLPQRKGTLAGTI